MNVTLADFAITDAALLHIDVQRRYAVDFGTHWRKIDAFVAQARGMGMPVAGVVADFDSRKARVQALSPRAVRRDMDQYDSGDSIYGALIRPVDTDTCWHKSQNSALAGGGVLRDWLAPKKLVLVAGYFADDCVLQTVRHISQQLPQVEVVLLSDLCLAIQQRPFAHQYYDVPRVTLTPSTAVHLDQGRIRVPAPAG